MAQSAGKRDPSGFRCAPFSGAVHDDKRQIVVRPENRMHKSDRRGSPAENGDIHVHKNVPAVDYEWRKRNTGGKNIPPRKPNRFPDCQDRPYFLV
jgi:hypothetical protein